MLNEILKILSFLSILICSNLGKEHINNTFSFLDVKFKIVKNGESPNRYIWLHGDEKTAEMALDFHINNYNKAYLANHF